jgi:hypothetical protein
MAFAVAANVTSHYAISGQMLDVDSIVEIQVLGQRGEVISA